MKGNAVEWHNAEPILIGTEGDVFAIFDCCNAGRLCQFRGLPRFEYLGACSADEVTATPGCESFTEALIWALQELRKESAGSFPTSALQQKIKKAPGFPKNQYPPLGHRIEASPDHIHIAPHNPDYDASQSLQRVPSVERPPTASEYFDLRFHYSEITDKVIVKTAHILNRALQAEHEDKLPASRITFLKRCPPEPMMNMLAEREMKLTEFVVGQWLAQARKRIKNSQASPVFQDEPLTPVSRQDDAQSNTGANKAGLKRKADDEVEDEKTRPRVTKSRIEATSNSSH